MDDWYGSIEATGYMKKRYGTEVDGMRLSDYDPIGTVLYYNSQKGIYRMQKQNIRGGNSWIVTLSYDRTLAKNLQFQSNFSEQWNTSYGILTMTDEQTGLSYNRQSLSHRRGKLGLTYET